MENPNYGQALNRPILTKNFNSIILPFPTSLSTESVCSNFQTNRNNRIVSEGGSRSSVVITQPIIEKLSSDQIKREEIELSTSENRSKSQRNPFSPPILVTSVPLNLSETVNHLSMSNSNGHLMSTLNSSQLNEGNSTYFGQVNNYKVGPSSNSDLPSPSSSSNSSNPPSSSRQTNATRRHGETSNDPSRKREMRLQKNREAARECRRKKKEYIKCLEERIASLESQNKALIEELRKLKELYCFQRDDSNSKSSTNKGTAVSTPSVNHR